MRDVTRQRKAILRGWELWRANLLESTTAEALVYYAGGLLALSYLLEELRHNGDGTAPIRSDRWVVEARAVIRQHPMAERLDVLSILHPEHK